MQREYRARGELYSFCNVIPFEHSRGIVSGYSGDMNEQREYKEVPLTGMTLHANAKLNCIIASVTMLRCNDHA